VTERDLLVDCLRRLNRAEMSYMLTGSMASNYWGIPRTTHDLDFVIQLPISSIAKLAHEFQGDYYFDEEAIRTANLRPPHQFNLIDTRSALKVDFWYLRPKPPFFEREMFARRIKVPVFGERAWLATAEDVILHKLYWHQLTPSERQLNDAAGIREIQKENLDAAYLRHWAKELGLTETLEKIFSGQIRPKTT
jgi:hypothetical protein